MNYDNQKLTVNDSLHHLELEVEGNVAFIEYNLINSKLFLIHTEIPDALAGKGVGNAIVQKALQYAKDNNYKIVPLCTFVYSYLQRHKEWSYLIASDSERFTHKT